MNSNRFRSYLALIVIFVLQPFFLSCEEKPGDENGNFDVSFSVPESVELEEGETSLSFRIMFGKSPLQTDVVVLTDTKGTGHDCPIIGIQERNFTVALFDGYFQDIYKVGIRRGREYKEMGEMTLSIRPGSLDLRPGVTVYGKVLCGGKPVSGAVVSDGVEVVATDENGLYQMESAKENGYVFISVPSGYKVESNGVLPLVSKKISDPKRVECVDFYLTEDPGQENHTMLVFGDMHLANRNNDKAQFNTFLSDVNFYISAHSTEKIYGLTLGDMTWDIYWINNNMDLNNYLECINIIKGIQIFHTIGNHDHSCYLAGDFPSAGPYRQIVSPTNYSFNIGKVHYIVLDDIFADNTGNYSDESQGRRHSAKLIDTNLAWLKKDLAFVPKSTPLVIAMHAPLYGAGGSISLGNGNGVVDAVKDYSEVHFMTAHSHKLYNIDKLKDKNIYEHNTGAVCATWWWTGKNYPGIHIGQDGAEGGYRIVNINGTDFKWQFKATGKPESLQFRTYDGNKIDLRAETVVPDATDTGKGYYELYAGEWKELSSDNYVYINVWDYDPDWTVSVTENGAPLVVENVSVHDPLHVLSYTAKSINGNSAKPTFATSYNSHTFKVQASAPNTTLEIKVTDRFGREYTETMARPKEFSINTYK